MKNLLKSVAYQTLAVFALLSILTISTAFAQDEGVFEAAGTIYEAVASGNYAYAGALALILAVSLLRRYGGVVFPAINHPLVSPVLVLITSASGTVAAATAGGAALTWAVAISALKVALYAAGGYALAKPYLLAVAGKAPAWAKPIISLILFIFESKSAAKAAVAKKAGEKAVKENPAKGSETEFSDYP